ncbi:threonine-phosphate decarboxylase [Prochlorococcus marinus str. MU1404]|uniref:pyridoxal phosphate-dependent aminotransferase n=1 Tax=Prochlorococcus marinus TaxID=1219 RepID=UPI001ADB6DE7|nr:histidinol-phosphate transaminase [Prochlorococcus marinus]MBO8229369.1 aminotransferase class I/II-fold pyridoxal phosphate-dependent enzyme [Prochlorococcus marinus XMU1404]MBW3072452.1 threonine-phosphate decarboxylase [Prochlorococcus marinus str. MU1404]MCR8544447.1 aminotransferase class I/II-fold pyridoxal phosphate-dependent enzyme [Prochlorococcus marinus CUG1432]
MNKSESDEYSKKAMKILNFKHGGNVYANSKKLNLLPSEIIDASASLVPFDPPKILIDSLNEEIKKLGFRYYPERNLSDLKETIGKFHGINPENILPGNGASELITWAGYEATKFGISCIPSPGFVDYERSLNCWNSNFIHCELPKSWNNIFPQSFPLHPKGDVIWITNPHNPTGQLWERNSLETIIKKYKLVICDEAFLSITPNGEKESLIPLTKKYDNLLVLRSLTKIFNIPGLRLGYIIGSSKKIKQWKINRDPWPLNSFAIKAGIDLLSNKKFYEQWTRQIHSWINIEREIVCKKLSTIKNLKVHNSSTNFFLIESKKSLLPNIKYLENKGILLRECTSFRFLDEKWARISLQSKKNNILLCKEIQNSFKK